ncbi:MAG: dephospho-CoA kinase [Parasporobacterium sp.]|nr:dephospho-CoA kinase [Parasporobacterium sp.]
MIIGLTGAVGAGKSTLLNILKEKFNAHIIEADKVGHLVMKKGESAFDKILQSFGDDILAADGEIDRIALGKIVFGNEENRGKINEIVHPEVKKYIEDKIKSIQANDKDALIVVEAALLIEGGYKNVCDEMWYVYLDDSLRRQRLKESRGYDDKKIDDILSGQLSDAEFRASCDFVIDNGSDMDNLTKQIDKKLKK